MRRARVLPTPTPLHASACGSAHETAARHPTSRTGPRPPTHSPSRAPGGLTSSARGVPSWRVTLTPAPGGRPQTSVGALTPGRRAHLAGVLLAVLAGLRPRSEALRLGRGSLPSACGRPRRPEGAWASVGGRTPFGAWAALALGGRPQASAGGFTSPARGLPPRPRALSLDRWSLPSACGLMVAPEGWSQASAGGLTSRRRVIPSARDLPVLAGGLRHRSAALRLGRMSLPSACGQTSAPGGRGQGCGRGSHSSVAGALLRRGRGVVGP